MRYLIIILVLVAAVSTCTQNEARELGHEAQSLYQKGDYKEAVATAERGLKAAENAKNNADIVLSLNNLAFFYQMQGKYVLAGPLLERALKIQEEIDGPEHPDVAALLEALGIHYSEQGDYKKAESLLKHALAIQEKMLG